MKSRSRDGLAAKGLMLTWFSLVVVAHVPLCHQTSSLYLQRTETSALCPGYHWTMFFLVCLLRWDKRLTLFPIFRKCCVLFYRSICRTIPSFWLHRQAELMWTCLIDNIQNWRNIEKRHWWLQWNDLHCDFFITNWRGEVFVQNRLTIPRAKTITRQSSAT